MCTYSGRNVVTAGVEDDDQPALLSPHRVLIRQHSVMLIKAQRCESESLSIVPNAKPTTMILDPKFEE